MAANLSRRTGHPREDLDQIAMVGIILAARRYVPERGFLIKVPPSWRELHARGKKFQGAGLPSEVVVQRLRVEERRWEEIVRACSVGVVPLGPIEPL